MKPLRVDMTTKALAALLAPNANFACLSGAGLSTDSGIPDYRSPNGAYSRGHKPITHQQYVGSERVRARFWIRAFAGASFFSSKKPNQGHLALWELVKRGVVNRELITQNVDGLLQKGAFREEDAGSVIELHGSGSTVKCLSCDHVHDRSAYLTEFELINSDFLNALSASTRSRPDGDAEVDLPEDFHLEVTVPNCSKCGVGVVKPNYVFFGASLDSSVKHGARRAIDSSNGLLVLGTSLNTRSALSLVERARTRDVPIVIINAQATRGDSLATLMINSDINSTLQKLLVVV